MLLRNEKWQDRECCQRALRVENEGRGRLRGLFWCYSTFDGDVIVGYVIVGDVIVRYQRSKLRCGGDVGRNLVSAHMVVLPLAY